MPLKSANWRRYSQQFGEQKHWMLVTLALVLPSGVLASVIAKPRPDVYTRRGSRQQVISYFSELGSDH